MAKWYCGMCEEWFTRRGDGDCPKCGFGLEGAAPEPKEPPKVVNLMDALRTALEKVNAKS